MNSGPIPFAWEIGFMNIGALLLWLDPLLFFAATGIMFFGGFFGALAYNQQD